MSSTTRPANKRKPAKRGKGLSLGEKIIIPVILFVIVWAAYSYIQAPGTNNGQPSRNTLSTASSTTGPSAAPDFTLPSVDQNGLTGKQITLSSLRGKVVLLEFMEPWCVHCQNMAPILDNLHQQFGQNVVFISVSGPLQGATVGDTAKFIGDYKSGLTYVFDSTGGVFNTYGVSGTPTFFIIGKNGTVTMTLQGEQTHDALANALTQASS